MQKENYWIINERMNKELNFLSFINPLQALKLLPIILNFACSILWAWTEGLNRRNRRSRRSIIIPPLTEVKGPGGMVRRGGPPSRQEGGAVCHIYLSARARHSAKKIFSILDSLPQTMILKSLFLCNLRSYTLDITIQWILLDLII